jgi:hypothetical protein
VPYISALKRYLGYVRHWIAENGLSCLLKTGSRGNWALADAWYTVHPWGLPLKKAMPVHTRSILWTCDVVVHRDLYPVAPISFYQWSWKLTIDVHNLLHEPIRVVDPATDCEIIVASYTSMRRFLRVIFSCCSFSPGVAIWERLNLSAKRKIERLTLLTLFVRKSGNDGVFTVPNGLYLIHVSNVVKLS